MPSRLRPRLLLSVFLASVGTASVAAHVAGASAQVRSACGSHSVPTLSVSPKRTSQVIGSVLVAAAGRRITVGASRRSETGLRSTSAAAWLEFCLRRGAVTKSVTLVRVAPSGVNVSLTREGRLTVSDAVRGTRSSMAVVDATTHDELVLVLLDRRQGRASVFVNGKRKASVPAVIPAAVHVSVGSSSFPAMPSPVSDTPPGQVARDTPTAFAATTSP